MKTITKATIAIIFLGAVRRVAGQSLTDAQIRTVRARLGDAAQASWERGTRAQVLIEYDAPKYNVLSTKCEFPPPAVTDNSLSTPFQIAQSAVASKPANSLTLVEDGSAADPASLGPVVLLANWTGQAGADYRAAAEDQLDFLLNHAPRTSDGAISHRNDKVQLWSDFVYMVPPFLAYYGALQKNRTLMDEAFHQIELYRDQLHDDGANNLWKHIVMGGSGEDPGHWSTGNGWAAMGMLRVMGTIKASSMAGDFPDQINTLQSWVEEIIDGMYDLASAQHNTALFRNYPDNTNTFYDASSTAFMAAVTYRLAVLTDGKSVRRIPDAERARKELCRHAGDAGGHIDGDGWLSPVVDPHNFPQQGSHSAEGQAFVVSMMAGYNAWNGIGQPGVNAATMRAVGLSLEAVLGLASILAWALF